MRRAALPLVLAALAISPAAAAPLVPMAPIAPGDGVRRTVAVEPTAAARTSPVLFLNRCVGGCIVRRGNNDATTDSSSILQGSGDTMSISPFGYTDGEWQAVVACVREVYSPYQVTVTDTRPASGGYNEAIVAGIPIEIGYNTQTLGVAPLARDCSPLDDAVSFSFANAHPAQGLVANLCWTVAQESAHVYGLDHEFAFLDGYAALTPGGSACADPMTYRGDCLGVGIKFFRDSLASCGTLGAAQPGCGPPVSNYGCRPQQNSHALLLDIFGAGQTTSPPPEVSLTLPTSAATVDVRVPVHAQVSARRGVTRVELVLNGTAWDRDVGVQFEQRDQPASDYALPFPASLPDGIVDLQVRATDDLGQQTMTTAMTFTKGQPCVDASTCRTGQRCDAGRCLWDPPTGEVGDACAYPQACKSQSCTAVGGQQVCTVPCALGAVASVAGESGTCPSGFTCALTTAASGAGAPGLCIVDLGAGGGGGCCEVRGGGGQPAPPGPAILVGLVVAWLARRRNT